MTLPLVNQDKDAIALDRNFSTTRLVTREKPVITNDPSSKVESVLFLPPNPERKGEGGLRTKGYFKRSYDQESGLSDNLHLPLVTIITVVFNGEKYLEQTIQSVINQNYDNVEYIIIDGGSTDGTVDIIRKYEDRIDYWVSEPDNGIYDAMNKGISLSTGNIIGIINSDDFYVDDAIVIVVQKYKEYLNPDCKKQLIIGGSMFGIDDNNHIRCKIYKTKKYFDANIDKNMPVNHPTTFIDFNLYTTVGVFNTKYKIAADYDLIYRSYCSQVAEFVLIDDFIASMRSGGLSTKFKSLWLKAKERYLIRKNNISLHKNLIFSLEVFLTESIKQLLIPMLNGSLLSVYYRYRENKNQPIKNS
jgi:glycosyltransferase involved in cell wall biosynthesis